MSSMRNAVQRRNHKERAQPLERVNRFGLLEKRKDYKLRAADFRAKKNRLKALSTKAAERNPDEFYYHMINSKTKKGIHVLERPDAKPLDQATVQLLKTQDAGYVRAKLAAERRKVERLEVETGMLTLRREDSEDQMDESEVAKKKKHIVFVSDKEEALEFDPVKHFGTVPELLDRTENRPRVGVLERLNLEFITSNQNSEVNDAAVRKAQKARARKLEELAARMKRTEELSKAERALELQRERMKKGAGKGKPGQFGRERKR